MQQKTMTKLVRGLLLTVLVLVVLLAALFTLSGTSWFQGFLERRIAASLINLTGGRVEISGMRYRPLIFEITMDRIVIRGREQPTEPPLFWARNVEAQINPVSLIHFGLFLRNLAWQRANIHLETYPGGFTNLPGPYVSPELKDAVSNLANLSVKRLRLEKTNIEWNAQRLPLEISGNDISILLKTRPDHQYDGSLSSPAVKLKGKFGDFPALALSSEFTFSSMGGDLHSLDWRLGTLKGNATASLRWYPSVQADFKLAADGEIAQALRAARIHAIRDGQARLNADGSYRDGSLTLRGQLESRRLDFRMGRFHPGFASLSTDFNLAHHQIAFSRLHLDALRGRLQGEGRISFRSPVPHYEIHGLVHGVELASLMQSLGQAAPAIQILRPQAKVQGNVMAQWEGSFKKFRSKFDLKLSPSANSSPNLLPLTGQIQGSLTSDPSLLLSLSSATVQTPHSVVTTQGTFGAGQSGLNIKAATTDFEEWRPVAEYLIETRASIALSLQQPAQFSGIVSGSFALPVVQGHFQAGHFEYHGWKWDGFQADARLAPNGIKVSSVHLEHDRSVLKMDVAAELDHWKLQRSSAVHLSLNANQSPLQGLRAGLRTSFPLEGYISGKFALDGTVENLEGRGEVQISQGQIGPESFNSATARIKVTHSEWDIQNIRIAKGTGRADGNARLNLSDRTYSMDLQGTHFALSDFSWKAGAQKLPPLRRPVQGMASFDLHGTGSMDNVTATLVAHITDLSLYKIPVGTFQAKIGFQGKQITASGAVEGPGGQFNFSGGGNTLGDWPLEISGAYTKFHFDPWIHFLSNNQLGAAIIADGEFNLSASLKPSRFLVGQSEIHNLEIQFPGLDFKNEHPIKVRYNNNHLAFDSFRMHGPGTNFEVHGSMETGPIPSLSFDATGQTDATLLSLLDSSLHATGDSELQVHVGGSLTRPLLRGSLDINNVSLGYGDLPLRVNGLNGRINLEGERAVITRLQGTAGGGTVSLSGFVTVQNLPRYEIRASLSQVRIRYPSDFTSVLDGNLVLIGTEEHGQVNGDLALRNIFVNENFNLFALVAETTSRPEEFAFRLASPLASRIALKVHVTSAPAVRLETRDVHLVADVDLRVQGTLANPAAVGDVHLRSGDAIFRGNRYTLARGDIALNNPFRTEPVFDLEAQTRVQRYDLTLEASGPLDRLRIAYRSDPPLPTEDIVSLLALGYSRREQEMGTASNRAFSSVGASALLSEALSTQFSGRIQQLFGVSRIKIDPNVSEAGATAGPRITVEQQLSPDFTLTYITSTANSQYRVIQFEWDISQQVSLIGIRDRNGIFGLELQFRKRFK